MNRMKAIIFAASVFLLLPTLLQAQDGPPYGKDRARTYLVVQIADALDLSDDKALQVSKILRNAESRRQDLRADRQRLEQELRQDLRSDDKNSGELEKLIARVNEIDRELALIPEGSMHKVQAILTTEEQAELVLFRPELQNQIRGALHRRMGGGRGGPQGGRPFAD